MARPDIKKKPEYQLVQKLGLLEAIEFTGNNKKDLQSLKDVIYNLSESDRIKFNKEQSALYSAYWQQELEKDPYYIIEKILGMEPEKKYSATNKEEYEKSGSFLSKELKDRIRNNEPEQNSLDEDTIRNAEGLSPELITKLTQKFKKMIEKVKGDKHMTEKTTVEVGAMEEGNEWGKKFHDHILYHFAKENNLLEGISDSISTEEELNAALKKISERMKEKETPADKSIWDATKEFLGKDKPAEGTEAAPTPVPEENVEGKPADKIAPKETTTAESIGNVSEEPTEELEPNWVKNKKDFWKKFAADNACTPSFENPDKEAKEPFYCALSKEGKAQGEVTYTAPNKVQISKDSDFLMYQGIVKDVVESGNTLTLGKTLNDTQRLMFYAAALSSPDRYKDDGSKIQVVNPPALTPELLKSETFTKLPENVQAILKAQVAVDRVAYLRKVIEEGKKDEYKAGLTKDQLKARNAKEEERDKIMAARLGLTGDYETKYLRDIKDVKNEDGSIKIPGHKKGDKRIVKSEEELIKNRSGHISDKDYARLAEKFAPKGR